MTEQERYWELITQVRFEVYYTDGYISRTHNWETWQNAITAIASSGSIAGWIIWKDWGIIWAGIIALSQVINALKPILPFTRRLKLLQEMYGEITRLSLEIEEDWFGISQGDFTERQINQKRFDRLKKKEVLRDKYLGSHVLPLKEDIERKANELVDVYLYKNYIGEGDQKDE